MELLGHRLEPAFHRAHHVGAHPRLELLHRAERLLGDLRVDAAGRSLRGGREALGDHAVVGPDHLRERGQSVVHVLGHPLLGLGARGDERLHDGDAHRVDGVRRRVQPLERLLERGRDRDVGRLGRSLGDRLGDGSELGIDALGQRRHVPLDRAAQRDRDRGHPLVDRVAQTIHLLRRVALHQFPERLRVRTGQLREPHDARLDQAFHRDLVLLARAPLDAYAFGEHLDLLRGLARLVRDRGADLLGQRLVVGGERRRMLFDPLRQPAHRLRTALHVALHRLDDPRGLAGDEVAVLHDPLLDRAGEVLVALVEVRERRRDVRLDLLELRADHLDALERRGVRDLVDRVRRELDRLTNQAAVLGELSEGVLEARRAERQRLEPVVARRDEALDRLVPRDEAEDPLLLVGGIRARRAPHLRGDLAHQGRRVLLDGPQAVVQPFRDREVERARTLRRDGTGFRGVGATGEQSTPGAAGTFRRVRGIGVHVEASRSGAGAMRRAKHRSRVWPEHAPRDKRMEPEPSTCAPLPRRGVVPILRTPKSPTTWATGAEGRSSIW